MAQRLNEAEPLKSLKVQFALRSESYRFPIDEEFRHSLSDQNIYGLRVCRYLLERLENADTKEPTDTSSYSIEHVLPQNENLSRSWRLMLGDGWKDVQREWLHRLGNMTLTGYNSKYSDRPFEEKKTIRGGFNDSAVRLNKFVREQLTWNADTIQRRGHLLTGRCLQIWPDLQVPPAWVDAARVEELRDLAARRKPDQVAMSEGARELFDELSKKIRDIGDVIEVPWSKSIMYYGPSPFAEVIPMKHGLRVLLAMDFNEVHDPDEIVEDTSEYQWIPNARLDAGAMTYLESEDDMSRVVSVVRQAFDMSAS